MIVNSIYENINTSCSTSILKSKKILVKCEVITRRLQYGTIDNDVNEEAAFPYLPPKNEVARIYCKMSFKFKIVGSSLTL